MADDISANTKGRVMDLELLLAEYFGRDGDGGRFKQLEDEVRETKVTMGKNETRIAALETINLKLGVIKTLLLMAGGIVAAIAMKGIDKLF